MGSSLTGCGALWPHFMRIFEVDCMLWYFQKNFRAENLIHTGRCKNWQRYFEKKWPETEKSITLSIERGAWSLSPTFKLKTPIYTLNNMHHWKPQAVYNFQVQSIQPSVVLLSTLGDCLNFLEGTRAVWKLLGRKRSDTKFSSRYMSPAHCGSSCSWAPQETIATIWNNFSRIPSARKKQNGQQCIKEWK